MTKARILIVEDERIVAADIQRSLEGIGYSVVDAVATGTDAVTSARDHRPDLILMDVVLEGEKSGIQAADEIRQRFRIPVIYLTAYADENILHKAKETEPYGYILKPFDNRELHGTIEMALQRHSAEKALRESEEKYRHLVEQSLQGLMILQGQKPRIVFANSTLCAMTGYGIEELYSLTAQQTAELMHSEDCERIQSIYRQRLNGQASGQPSEARIIRKDGEVRWLQIFASCIGHNGEQALQVSCIDVTDRKQAEEALKESERRYRVLFETSPDGIVTSDLQGRILEANQAFQGMLDYRLDELQSMTYRQITPANGGHEETKHIKANWKKGSGTFEKEYLRKDGAVFPVALSGWVIKDEKGRPKKLGMFVRDITQRKQAEKDLRQSYEKLSRLIEEIVETLASAVEMRDPYTAGHQRRVAVLACTIAERLKIPRNKIQGLRMAALIHDIGKIYVPAEILNRPGVLNDNEFNLIKSHSQAGYDLLKSIEFPWPVVEIVLQHHERLNGSGFPQGLKGEQILLEARILAVADVVEAMSSHRPYRPAHRIQKTLEELRARRGTLYDPQVVDACLALYEEEGFALP
jgi:PAS domain S-box-containing protein/putative nucleotidyltransferase with HDIG domain